jgi:simple sugar transport system permease protein
VRDKVFAFICVAVGLVLVLVATLAVFGLPVGSSLHLIADGAFGDKYAVARTLVRFAPLVVTGLGITIAWRAGMYNIGGEGQFVVGGLCGATLAKFCSTTWPPALLTGGILVACVLGGAAYGSLAAWLAVKRGVNVVISTILLNFVATQLLSWAVGGPLRQTVNTLPLTQELPDAAMLYHPDRTTDLHAGVAIAALMAVAVYLLLFHTKSGFLIRLVGDNARAARANRVNEGGVRVAAMALSGGLCGLAGATEYLGMSGQLGTEFAQGWGFLAIPVALLGALNPLGVLLSALYFGALLAGSSNLARFTQGGDTLIYIVQAVAVLGLIGASAWIRDRRRPAAAEEP